MPSKRELGWRETNNTSDKCAWKSLAMLLLHCQLFLFSVNLLVLIVIQKKEKTAENNRRKGNRLSCFP